MTLLTPSDHAEAVALFRSEIIGALVRRELAPGALQHELAALSQIRFRPPGSPCTRTYSVPTLRRWYHAYRQGGLAALRSQPRQDRGHGRALPAEQRELLCQIRRENPHASATLILRTLVADGRIAKGAVSPVTVRRLFRERGLDRQPRDAAHPTQRLRWQAARPNALWHADVCHGAPLRLEGGRTQPVRIHALLDDATRYVLAIDAFASEEEACMLQLWVRALRRYGAPQTLYLDNGSTYRGQALRLACERLGTTLVHAKPYDAPARGKMERFWRTLRAGCLDHLGQMSSLHEVNVRLYAFVDQHYHRAPHASLLGRTPEAVWHARTAERPADALGDDALRAALTVRERRRVRKDSTLSLAGVLWEVEAGFLAGHTVTVARSLAEPGRAPWVEHEDRSMALHRVDVVRNARRKRTPLPAAPPKTTPFDPPGALLDRAVGRPPRHREEKR